MQGLKLLPSLTQVLSTQTLHSVNKPRERFERAGRCKQTTDHIFLCYFMHVLLVLDSEILLNPTYYYYLIFVAQFLRFF